MRIRTKTMKKRILSLLLCTVMLCGFVPYGIVDHVSASNGIGEDHAEHTRDCGYSEVTEGVPCTDVSLPLDCLAIFSAESAINGVRSTQPVNLSDLKIAINGTDDKTTADAIEMNEPVAGGVSTYDNGTKFHKAGDNTDYFGYAWDSAKGWWGIEAWNETVEGTTVRNIKLNANVEGSRGVAVSGGRTVVLDLNGHTVSGTGSYVLGVAGGSTLTVRDDSGTGSIIGGAMAINDQGTFRLESGTVRATGIQGYAVYVTAKGSLETSGDIYSEYIGIRTLSKNTNINGGTVTAKQRGIYVDPNSSAEVTGGKITGDVYGIYATGSGSSVTLSDNGKVTSDDCGICIYKKSSVTITGGTVDAKKNGVYTYDQASFNMSGGTVAGGTNGVSINRGGDHTVSGGTITGLFGLTIFGYHKVDGDGNIIEEPYGKTKLTVSGGTIAGYYHGICGNGQFDTDNYSRGSTIINILDDPDIEGVPEIRGCFGATPPDEDTGDGIYHPQLGELNISGGNITGATGIEMRAGTLNLTGGTVTGTKYTLIGQPNGSGNTVMGAGIVASQHRERQAININISGGTITGYTSFYEDAFQGNTDEDLAKSHFNITGGEFFSRGGASAAFSRHLDSFITGGMYSEAVGRYTPQAGNIRDHLGYLTEDELKNIATIANPDSKVICVKVENDTRLPYHVGYLTGTGYDIELEAGSKSDQLVPTYSLNGKLVKGDNDAKGKIINVVYVDANNVNVLVKNEEGPVITGWASENENIATVDENGVVKAVSASSVPVAITATLLNGETVTFHVTVIDKAPPASGNLTVSKTVSGGGASSTKAFTFHVTLDDQTIGGTYGDMTFENGVAAFTLKAGESKTASNLPAGVVYTVEESNNEGYTVTVNGTDSTTATGTIAKDTTTKEVFNNHKAGGGGGGNTDPNDSTGPANLIRTDVPHTGDDINVFLWITLTLVSCYGLTGTLVSKRRRKN